MSWSSPPPTAVPTSSCWVGGCSSSHQVTYYASDLLRRGERELVNKPCQIRRAILDGLDLTAYQRGCGPAHPLEPRRPGHARGQGCRQSGRDDVQTARTTQAEGAALSLKETLDAELSRSGTTTLTNQGTEAATGRTSAIRASLRLA
jgi:hypothetical protein